MFVRLVVSDPLNGHPVDGVGTHSIKRTNKQRHRSAL